MKRKIWFVVLGITMVVSLILSIALPTTAAGSVFLTPITITDTSGTSRTNYPVIVPLNIASMQAAGLLSASGLDSGDLIGTSTQKFMFTNTGILINQNTLAAFQSNINNLYTNGYSPAQTSMPIIVGDGGDVRIPYNSSLDFGYNDFEIEMNAYLAGDDTIYNKAGTLNIYTSSGNVLAEIEAGGNIINSWQNSLVYNGYLYLLDNYAQNSGTTPHLEKVSMSNYSMQQIDISTYVSSVYSPFGYVMGIDGTNLYIAGSTSDISSDIRQISTIDLVSFAETSVHTYVPTAPGTFSEGSFTDPYLMSDGVVNAGYFYLASGGTVDKIRLSDGANVGHLATTAQHYQQGIVWSGSNLYCGVYYGGDYGIAKVDTSTMMMVSYATHHIAAGYPMVDRLLTSGNYIYSLDGGSYRTVMRWTISPLAYDIESASGYYDTGYLISDSALAGSYLYFAKRADTGSPYIGKMDLSTLAYTPGPLAPSYYEITVMGTDGTNAICLDTASQALTAYVVQTSDLIQVDTPTIAGYGTEEIDLSVPYTQGENTILLEGGQATLTLTIGSSSDSAPYSNIIDTTNDTYLMSSATPYLNYLKISGQVGEGTTGLLLEYQPDTIIQGDVLPDLAGTQDGVITFGTNSGISFSTGGSTSQTSYIAGTGGNIGIPTPIPVPSNIPGYVEQTTEPTQMPEYDLFHQAAIALGWGTFTLYGLLEIFVAICLGMGVGVATGSTLLAALACFTGLLVGFGTGQLGLWIVICYGILALTWIGTAKSF